MQKKNIIEISITGVLVIGLIFVTSNALSRAKQARSQNRRPPAEKFSQKDVRPEQQKVEVAQLFRRLEQESKDLKLKRDPFAPRPTSSTDAAYANLHLKGIVWDKQDPRAIINDIILGIGDRVEGNTIVEITPEKVILNNGSYGFELWLGQ